MASENTHNFEYLDRLINSNNGEIVLDRDIILDNSERNAYRNGISIERDGLVLDGNNHYIDSNTKTRIFEITGRNITIKNLRFKNGSDKKGAAIYNKNDDVTLINCNFENNSSRQHGGVIYNIGKTLKLVSCDFNDNSSRGHGGVIYNDEGSMIMVHCTFYNNAARKYGGVLYNNSSLNFEKCKFKDNYSESHGGALYNDNGNLVFNDCCFDDNSSKKYGGAIYNDNGELNFNKSKFRNNNAESYGGVIYNKGIVQFNACEFIDNAAMKLGSTIWTNSNVNIYKSIFIDSIPNQKSGIYQEMQDSTLNINSSSFEYKFLKDGEIIYIKTGYCLLENASFTVLEEPIGGHLLYNKKGELIINKLKADETYTNSIYNDNILKIKNDENLENLITEGRNSQIKYDSDKLPDGWKGFDYLNMIIDNATEKIILDYDIIMHDSEKNFYEGGIEILRDGLTIDGANHIIDAKGLSRIFYIVGKDICLKNIKFKNGQYFYNYLNADLDGGGAINILHDSSVKIVNCEFIENSSRNSSGAICNKGKLTIDGETKFLNNIAKKNGGAISNYNAELVLKGNCHFDKNAVELNGGAIFNTGDLTISDGCEFTYNKAKDNGGAIFNNSKFELSNSIFSNNSSKEGGSIFTTYNNQITFNGCIFKNNSAGSGGAISNDGKLLVDGCDFIKNSANYKGGAICIEFGSDLNIRKSNFNENSSEIGFGGAIGSNMGNLKIEEECIFEKNFSSGGGAIFYSGSSMIIDNSYFLKNIVRNSAQVEINGGGAIFTKGVANKLLSIKNCAFNINKSVRNGGAVFVDNGSYVDFTGCKFENNESRVNGDSIFNEGTINLNDFNEIKDKIVNDGKVNLKTDGLEDMIINTDNGVIN